MAFLYNDQRAKGLRRALRRSPTEAELKIWGIVRNKQIDGLRFFRQYGIGNNILDFYCPALRLAVEIDGSQHIENEHDSKRTAFLNQNNVTVIRFWNNDVLSNPQGVYGQLYEKIEELKKNRNPS